MSYDPYYNNVSLLLHCDGTDTSTTFTDNSPSPKTVTANGNAQINTAQSKFGGASAVFDGTGDYLSVTASSSDFTFGTGDATIEMWVNFTSTPSSAVAYVLWGSTTINTLAFLIYENKIQFPVVGTSVTETAALSWNTGQWYHLAAVRLGNSFMIFRDGIQLASGTSTVSSPSYSTNPEIGTNINGYIDDIRITKGIARYTEAFSVPTEPFPDYGFDPYYDKTILILTCDGSDSSTTFTDKSPLSNSITVTSPFQVKTAQKKWGTGSGQSTGSTVGRLSIATSSLFNLSNIDFTCEAWVYLTNDTNEPNIFNFFSSGSNYWYLRITSVRKIRLNITNSGNNYFVQTSNAIPFNTWTHIAMSVISGSNTYKIFINGVAGLDEVPTALIPNVSMQVDITGNFDSFNNALYNGYIDDVRITKGIARYTTNFTPPDGPHGLEAPLVIDVKRPTIFSGEITSFIVPTLHLYL